MQKPRAILWRVLPYPQKDGFLKQTVNFIRKNFGKVFIMSVLATALNVPAIADELPNWIKHQPSGINFTDFAPSPDGQTVVFEYIDRSLGRNYLGLGLYNWQTGELKRIPNPPGKQLSGPSFSDDGKKLAVAIGNANSIFSDQIGVLDLTTMNLTPLTLQGPMQYYPVFQPHTDNILYICSTGFILSGLKLLNSTTKQDENLIDEMSGFHHIFRPSFVGQNKILFQAMGAYEPELRKQTVEFSAAPLAYQFNFGNKPQLLSLAAEQQAKNSINNDGAFDNLSASSDGMIITFVGRSAYHDKAFPDKATYELFKSQNNNVLQLTNHHSSIAVTRLSFDGKIIVFAGDIKSPYKLDLCIHKLSTGETFATNVLDNIISNPLFALK